MCNLAEGRDGYHYPGIATAVTIFFLFSFTMSAQESLPDAWASIMEILAEQGAGEESIQHVYDWYEQLIVKPLDLSKATRADLAKFGFLSVFQIESFIDYRSRFGVPLSVSELSMIDGFDANTVEILRPLVKLSNSFNNEDKRSKIFDSQLRTKLKFKADINNPYRYLRYMANYGRLSGNITMESDIGERWIPDFLSANITYGNNATTLILGDYIIRSGQGLALWKGFSLSSLASPASLMKTSSGIMPYRSADEFGYFRGVAASFKVSRYIEITAFASARPIDAKVEYNSYKTLPTTGLHVSDSELSARHSMLEYTAGAITRFNGERFTVGATTLVYAFNKSNNRPVKAYNLYQMYDRAAANISFDAALTLRHLRLFGEAAISLHKPSYPALLFAENNVEQLFASGIYTLPLALIAGVTYSPSGSFELALLARHYSPSYVAPHSGAYSSISSVANQTGALFSILWHPKGGFSTESSCDIVHYPWVRYPSIPPAYALKYRFKLGYENINISTFLQNYTSFQQHDGSIKNSPKISVKYAFSKQLNVTGAAYGSLFWQDGSLATGYGLSSNLQFSLADGMLVADAGALLFSTEGYSSRIYVYQKDLPQSFSIGMYQGSGSGAYAVLQFKAGRWLKLSFKAAGTFFNDDRDNAYDLKLQADIRF